MIKALKYNSVRILYKQVSSKNLVELRSPHVV